MRTLTHQVDGSECLIHFPESGSDMDGLRDLVASGEVLAVDTETTGLDIYSAGHRLRLVQIGTPRVAFVVDAARFRREVVDALRGARALVMHNASYDMQVLDRHLGVTIEELAGKTFDTKILAHLLDPRAKPEGGTGHGLKDLATIYVDPDADDGAKQLVEVFRREYGATKETGWAAIDLRHETFVRYAGMDVLLTRALFDAIAPMVNGLGLDDLSAFEHHLQSILATVQRRGMRIDVAYTEQLSRDLEAEAESMLLTAARFGVTNVNSTAQVAAALSAMGEELTDSTPSGQVKVDKQILLPLADLDMQWNRLGLREPNPLADAVLRAKRAEKWNEAYAQAFLGLRDAGDRLHPMINSLQARTARMSISRPPLQQLPASEARVRHAFRADPGGSIVSIDYSQVEVRVAAALSQDKILIKALMSGEDLHSTTARHIFGPDFTDKDRKIGKMVTFARLYGSGASNIARQAGVDMATAKNAVSGFDRAYSTLARYGRGLQRAAEFGKKEVVTPSGRHLPLDRDRLYAALNAMVQSTARDVLAQAIVDLHDKGMTDGLLLPIHDELLFTLPRDSAADEARAIADVMDRDFFGVPLISDIEVGGSTWGSLYE